jgi:hypothetical protein
VEEWFSEWKTIRPDAEEECLGGSLRSGLKRDRVDKWIFFSRVWYRKEDRERDKYAGE